MADEISLTKAFSCPDKSESLGFPLSGMKFDDVTQWVIADGRVGHIPPCRLALAPGRMVLTSYNFLQGLLWR
jgi:hypothetical protein